MTSTSVQPALLSAQEFSSMPLNGKRYELVRGRLVEQPMPQQEHGFYCNNISFYVTEFVKKNDLGRVTSNDSWVVTERDPDSVRGSDICFFSFKRLPRGPMPKGLVETSPELVFEVRSPSDRWLKLVAKAGEYIDAGVSAVCVVDPKHQNVSIFRPEEDDPTVLTIDDEFTLPDILPGFSVPVRKFFE
jgi:Uma2 family endonuclease